MAPAPLRYLRPPQQARSRATLHRFLEAALELLGERRFEEASVAEIARRARASVGAFYARFPDKDALLSYLNDRLFEEGRAKWDALLAPEVWRGRSVADIVAAVVAEIVRKRRAFRGLLRALSLHARSRPDPSFAEHAAGLNRHVHARLRDLLLERRREIGHRHPERAIAFGLLLVDGATREAILFGEAERLPGRLSDTVLARELTAAWLAYLGVRPRRSFKGSRARRGRASREVPQGAVQE
jgi:AcrR family transcriptional regulator